MFETESIAHAVCPSSEQPGYGMNESPLMVLCSHWFLTISRMYAPWM